MNHLAIVLTSMTLAGGTAAPCSLPCEQQDWKLQLMQSCPGEWEELSGLTCQELLDRLCGTGQLPEMPEQGETEESPAPEEGGAGSTESEAGAEVQEILRLVNQERAKAGLSALKLDSRVTAAAQVRAGEILGSFSHARPDGRSAFTALQEQGVSYRGAAENIAKGQKTAAQVMGDWMNSPSHRENILNPAFTTLGVGYLASGSCWVQMFTY